MTEAGLPVLHARDTAFSYRCGACSQCCYDKRIQVNPYELARLARNRGMSTTDVIDRFTVDGGAALVTRPDGGCVFLGPHGCTVHADRPLVCRLYPLGRIVLPDGKEAFVESDPHPETAGVYGQDGSVGSYLDSQGVAPYVAAADRYYGVLVKLLQAAPDDSGNDLDGAVVVDADLAVQQDFERGGPPVPADPESLMTRHLEILERLAARG